VKSNAEKIHVKRIRRSAPVAVKAVLKDKRSGRQLEIAEPERIAECSADSRSQIHWADRESISETQSRRKRVKDRVRITAQSVCGLKKAGKKLGFNK
jgi:hypothetical protein